MRHRSSFLLTSAVAVLLAPLSPAWAATLGTRLTGAGLATAGLCARHVDIRPDASLRGEVTVTATADHQEEIDRLLFESRDTARIGPRPHLSDCWHPAFDRSFTPTLELVLAVPTGFPIAIDESGFGHYAIGPVGGSLALALSGAVEMDAARVAALQADLSGAAMVRIAQVNGNVQLDLSGSGHVAIDQAEIGALAVGLSGAGGVSVAQGHVGTASLDTSGLGGIGIGAEVGNVTVDLSGAGSVHLRRVTGQLQKEVSGMGSVTVGSD